MSVKAHEQGQSVTTTIQPNIQRPKAIGFDISGPDAPERRRVLQRRAAELGYYYVYTVRPPAGHQDPIGYAITMGVGIHAAAIVVYDLEVVDHRPARVCDRFVLETVCPGETWSRAFPPLCDPAAHRFPDYELDLAESARIMQQHIECRALECPRKHTALNRLVRAGKIAPSVTTPSERAAERGIGCDDPVSGDTEPVGRHLRAVLDAMDDMAAQLRETA